MEKKREIMRQQMRLKRQMQRQFSRFSFPVFHYFKLHFWSILFFTVTDPVQVKNKNVKKCS